MNAFLSIHPISTCHLSNLSLLRNCSTGHLTRQEIQLTCVKQYLHIYVLTYLHRADLAQVAHVPYWCGSRLTRPQHWHCHHQHQLPSWEHDCSWQTENLLTIYTLLRCSCPQHPPTLPSRGRGGIHWFHLRHPVQFEDASGGVMGIIVSPVRTTRLLPSSCIPLSSPSEVSQSNKYL